jgi:hypothetical protein
MDGSHTADLDENCGTDQDASTLKDQLAALDQKRKSIAEQLADALNEKRRTLIARVRSQCEENGWDLRALANEIAGTPTKKQRSNGGAYGIWQPKQVWVDPNNEANVFRGRGLPAWMREQMTALGMDPKIKEDRERFRQENLRVVENEAGGGER